MFSKISVAVQALLTVSLFYLGYTIHSFTSAVITVVDTYPQLIEDVNQTTEKLEVDQWLEVARTVEELLPKVIVLAEELDGTISDINKTVASVDSKIPQILDEVRVVRSETIPSVLKTTDTLTKEAIPETLSELKSYRQDVIPPLLTEANGYRQGTIPAIISESEALREQVPELLAKADNLVEKSKEISQRATQGAIEGVILSPVNILRDAKDRITDQGVEPQ
ncbi:hypothetical protein P7F88_09540 [Vibrio hannami]|uniref:hypothetical protein n=1 Tax=Vibrio hannami TaxID=2717094 RepID=UPI00241092CD|nr:hypothetical protein [Vibrio hannami]MDG3086337.1 hypothetical protein [Vibrio hannami]